MANTRKFERDPDIAELLDSVEFYECSYEGGGEYAKKYLVKHERESEEAFKRRKEEACMVNFCAPVIDLYNFYLYRTDPVRSFDALNKNKLFEMFLDDSDFYGNKYNDVIKAISLEGSVQGVFGIIVDKPNISVKTMQEEIDQSVRPYIATYEIEDIMSIKYERNNGGKPVLVELILKEEDDRIKVWTTQDITWWKLKDKTSGSHGEYELNEGPVENTLKEIPFVLHRNQMSIEPLESASDIADLAHIQKAIFNNDSKMMEAMSKAAFPMMEIPDDNGVAPGSPGTPNGGTDDDTLVVGVGNALLRPMGDTIGYRYVEPQMTGTTRYLDIRSALLEDFSVIARTQHANAVSRQSQSGVALEIEFQQLNALLSMKASCMERTEKRIIGFAAKWIGMTDDGVEVKYGDSFGIRDLAHDIDTAIKSLAVVPSPAFKSELAKQVAGRVLDDDTDPDVMKKIDGELSSNASGTINKALAEMGHGGPVPAAPVPANGTKA